MNAAPEDDFRLVFFDSGIGGDFESEYIPVLDGSSEYVVAGDIGMFRRQDDELILHLSVGMKFVGAVIFVLFFDAVEEFFESESFTGKIAGFGGRQFSDEVAVNPAVADGQLHF